MLKMDVKGVRAFPMEKEPLTAGRVGLQIAFTFSPEWDDLEKIAVFEGSGTYVVPLVATDICAVPHEALETAGPSLKVGVYGMKNEDDELVRATPTVWANFGRIESGTYPAANEGENTVPPTPSDVDTILAAAEDAVETANDAKDLAQSVVDAAERGDFDGYSPAVTISSITGGHKVKITDKTHPSGQSFNVMDGESGVGVPAGGDEGQILCKQSGEDYDTGWTNPSARVIVYTESGGVVTSNPENYSAVRAAALSEYGISHAVAKLALSAGKTLGSASVKIDENNIREGLIFTFLDGTNGYKITHTSDGITLDTFTVGGGGGGTDDYDDLSNKPQINSVTLSGNKSTSDLGLDQVFWAVKGSTHNDAIHTAHAAGKIVLVEVSGRIYQMTEEVSSTKHRFTCADQGTVYWLEVSNNLWDFDPTSRAIPVAATSAPSDLGTAAVGSSAKYAKEDHVHENNVFAVTYTKTSSTTATCDKTFAGIVAAATAGKTIVAVLSGLFPATQTADFSITSATSFNVVAPIGGTGSITISHTSTDVISFSQGYGQEEITASGILKGNGAGGVSAAVAGTDYIDSMPSAADVGAIAAPASPSAGDVLTYSSGAWAAAAPAHQIPAGGNAGECLAKLSASDYELRWRTINDWTPAGLMRTNGGTAAKVAEWSFWSATQYPSWLVVTVCNSNTYAGAITLKVNGSTAYPIYINGTASSATNHTLPAGSYFVYFDGSKFDFRTDGKIPGSVIGHADLDIAAPASPSVGDFLVYTSNGWAAQSLSTWQGGSY